MREHQSVNWSGRRRKMPLRSIPMRPTIEETLQKALQTKVNITLRKDRGKIIIEFYSREDLERLAELITG